MSQLNRKKIKIFIPVGVPREYEELKDGVKRIVFTELGISVDFENGNTKIFSMTIPFELDISPSKILV